MGIFDSTHYSYPSILRETNRLLPRDNSQHQSILHINRLEPEVPISLPRWPCCLLGSLSVQLGSECNEVNFTSSSIDIDIGKLDTDAPLSVVDLVSNEESDDNWRSEVRLEEGLSIGLSSNRPQSYVELGDEAEDVEAETQPRSDCSEHGSEWQVVGGATSSLPRRSETDVSEADTSPSEEVGESGKGEKPVEDSSSILGLVDVCETAEEKDDDQHNPRATFLINLGTDGWSHTVCAESLDGTGGGECARVGDRDDRDCDHGVEDGRENLDAGKFEGQDEWRVASVSSRCG